MDARERLISWALERKNQLCYSVTQMTWTEEYLPTWKDVSVEMCYSDKLFTGRGMDKDTTQAVTKATSEAIERIVGYANGLKNSNGVAAHISTNLAIENARLEVVERDQFLCRYLTGSGFGIEISVDELNPDLLAVQKKLLSLGVEIKTRAMSSFDSVYTFFSYAHGGNRNIPFGICVGFGCHFSKKQAIEKSFLECLRLTVHRLLTEGCYQKSGDTNFLESAGPSDQLRVSGDISKLDEYLVLLSKQDDNIHRILDIDFNSIPCRRLSPPTIFSDCPLEIWCADKNLFQDVYFGPTCKENLNIDRLSVFTNKSWNFSKTELLCHPLG